MDVGRWLAQIGLPQYTASFRANDIDAEVLGVLDESDLEKLGVTSLGHRKRLLGAIRALKQSAPAHSLVEAGALARPRDPERRQLTVMFCDLVGSTALSERLDPEDFRNLIRGYQDCCAGVVTRFEGYVAKYLGDGVLIYFGYPRAHEDDAERAVRAALAIRSGVGALATKHEEALAVRIGLATGIVIVGDIIGVGSSQEEVVVGESPNIAARLQKIAGPNGIAISAATRDLIGQQFACHDLGFQALKGISRPIHAWQVTAEQPIETRFRAAHSDRLTTFVGREQELRCLHHCWRHAVAGQGQVVLLSGEAGIGKSRLVEVFRHQTPERRWTLQVQCSRVRVNSPLYPVIQHLQLAAGISPEDADETKLHKLEHLLGRAGALNTIGRIAALLAIPTEDRSQQPALSPLEQKQQTLSALVDLFESLAQQRPVLFVVEDAHWIDPTTRELLDILVDRISRLPAMVVVTHRRDFAARWTSCARCTTLALNRFDRDACVLLINDVAGSRRLPANVLDQIVSKTDGVPFFIEELTKTVLESRFLVKTDGAHALGGSLPPLAIPSTLQDSLMARLDRLGAAKEIAQIAAAIGRKFSHRLLEAVSPLKGAALSEVLRTLVQSRIIAPQDDVPEATYSFRHTLIQDTAYDTLLRSRRQQIHQQIAAALTSQGEVEPELIAHHLTQAGRLAAAAPEWLRAGRRALARSANLEAIAHLTRGLEALHKLPISEAVGSLELDMQISLGLAHTAVRGYSAPETEQAYARARALLSQTDEDCRSFAVLHGLAKVHWTRAQLASMRQVADEMLARADRQTGRLPRLVAHRAMAVVLNTTGHFAQASQHAEQAGALYVPDEDRDTAPLYGQDVGVGAHWHLAVARLFMGDVRASQASGMRAEELAGSLKNLSTTLYNVGLFQVL